MALSELSCLGCLAEIPEEISCNISSACANSFVKQLLGNRMWHKVLQLLTGKASGENPIRWRTFQNL